MGHCETAVSSRGTITSTFTLFISLNSKREILAVLLLMVTCFSVYHCKKYTALFEPEDV